MRRGSLRIGLYTDAPDQLVKGLATVLGPFGGRLAPSEASTPAYHFGQTSFEVSSCAPWKRKLRSMRNFPPFAFVHSVSYGECGSGSSAVAFDMSGVAALTQSWPGGQTSLRLGSHFERGGTSSATFVNEVKEVVIPYTQGSGPDIRDMLEMDSRISSNKRSAGVYVHSAGDVVFRLFPSSFVTIVVSTPHLEEAVEEISAVEGVTCDLMGNRALRQQQARLVHPDLFGLDLRLCDRTEGPLPFFHESNDALMSGLLPGVQSNRVRGGGPEVREDKFQGFGDCYSEFREMVQTPSRFFTDKNTTGPRISKLPSIKE